MIVASAGITGGGALIAMWAMSPRETSLWAWIWGLWLLSVAAMAIYYAITLKPISFRDQLAAKALTGLLMRGAFSRETIHLTASYAYELADAMLDAREPKEDKAKLQKKEQRHREERDNA